MNKEIQWWLDLAYKQEKERTDRETATPPDQRVSALPTVGCAQSGSWARCSPAPQDTCGGAAWYSIRCKVGRCPYKKEG